MAQYLWGPGHDQLLASRKAEYDAGWAYPVLGDLNSVATITNTSGQVLERFHDSIYGLPSQIDAYGADIGAMYFSDHTNHLYNGQYWEEQLTLNMYRERWMSPFLGRFISSSALTYPVAELNYLFCFNNPVSFVDYFGLAPGGSGEGGTLVMHNPATGLPYGYGIADDQDTTLDPMFGRMPPEISRAAAKAMVASFAAAATIESGGLAGAVFMGQGMLSIGHDLNPRNPRSFGDALYRADPCNVANIYGAAALDTVIDGGPLLAGLGSALRTGAGTVAKSGAPVFRQGTFADDAIGWEGNYVKGRQWATDNPLSTPEIRSARRKHRQD